MNSFTASFLPQLPTSQNQLLTKKVIETPGYTSTPNRNGNGLLLIMMKSLLMIPPYHVLLFSLGAAFVHLQGFLFEIQNQQ